MIAHDAEVLGDLRNLSPEQGERARLKMQAIVSTGNLLGTSATIRSTEDYPPMPPTELAPLVTLHRGADGAPLHGIIGRLRKSAAPPPLRMRVPA